MTDHAEQQGHPSTATYLIIAAILTIITLVEVGVFYVPALQGVMAPILLLLSSAKFILVVMFFMHLKQDHALFATIFTIPLVLALGVATALMLLFGVLLN
jgi:cytochrome c oxidase subunit 4